MPRPTTYRALGNFLRRHDEKRYAYRDLLAQDYRDSLASTRLVSSRGLLEICEIHAETPKSSDVAEAYVRSVPAQLHRYQPDQESVSIYLCTDSIDLFVNEALPKIARQFVLVTGDSDLSVSASTIKGLAQLLANPYLKKWFAQNLEHSDPKLEPLPIGLDFHTVWQSPGHFGGGAILPLLQEAEIRKIVRGAPVFSQRKPLTFCDWLGGTAYGDRAEAKAGIVESARVAPSGRMPRYALWQECAQYAFVASPFGIGIDCHRTWEALALGCVPIVKRTHMSNLFAPMPVLVVESWSQVTPGFLEQQQDRLSRVEHDFSALLLNEWVSRIGERSNQQTLNARLDQLGLLI